MSDITGTHKADAFNSTDFTDCCGLAVLRGDTGCPGCGAKVYFQSAPRSRNCLMCGQPRSNCHC